MNEIQLLNYLYVVAKNAGLNLTASALLYEARKRGYTTKNIPRKDKPFTVPVCLDGKVFTETVYPDGSITINYE